MFAATEPSATRFAATEPSVPRLPAPQLVATRPSATNSVATGPVATEPVATEPVATEPVTTQPLNARRRAATPPPMPQVLSPAAPVQTRLPVGGAAASANEDSPTRQGIPGGFRLPKKSRAAAWRTLAISMLALGFPATALGAGTGPAQRTTSVATHASGTTAPAGHARLDNTVLALGSGYSSPSGSPLVRVLQGDLEAGGYPPGHIDGLFGPRTRQAVVSFQVAHGLQVDGVVGQRTWAALSEPVLTLGPGAGDLAGGGSVVRSLQRRLASAGDSPGPIDGRYGGLTQGAVRRFQRAHGLPVTGIAGPRTLAVLAQGEPFVRPANARHEKRATPRHEKRATPATRSNPRSQPTGSTVARAPRERPASAARKVPGGSGHRPGSGSVPWIIILGGLALALVLALVVRLLIASLRRVRSRSDGRSDLAERAAGDAKSLSLEQTALTTRKADHEAVAGTNGSQIHTNGHSAIASAAGTGNGVNRRLSRGRADNFRRTVDTARAFNLGRLVAAEGGVVEARSANGRADERGHGAAASNLGRLLEEQGALAEAEAAYRRADERGDADGAFRLAVLLRQRGTLAEAAAAFGRASDRGDNAAAVELGVLLAEHGALAEAEAAFRRADERGDASAAYSLGVVLEDRGALAEAEAAYRRAEARGDADAPFRLGVLLRERRAIDEAAAAYGRASDRGHNGAAVELGVLLAEIGARGEAEAVFRRAAERGDASAAFNLGVVLEDRGALAEAEAAYRSAELRGDGEVAQRARAALLALGEETYESSTGRRTPAHNA